MYRYYGMELYHYGVQGRSGRYKWGTGSRPYQRLEKPKRQNFFQRRKTQRLEKQRAERAESVRKATEEKERLRSKKEEILNKGTASEILQYKKEFDLTNQELKNALERIQTTDSLRKYAEKDIKTGWDAMNDAMKKVDMVTNWANIGGSALNAIEMYLKYFDGDKEAFKNVKKSGGDSKKKPKGS